MIDNDQDKKTYDSFYNYEQSKEEYVKSQNYSIKGFSFPLNRNDPRGFFFRAINCEVIKADLIQLILTEPGERLMMPSYGTGLRSLIFDPVDPVTLDQANVIISESIKKWEPRIVVKKISVRYGESDRNLLKQIPNNSDNIDLNSIIISIDYALKNNLQGIESLVFKLNKS